MFLNAWCYKLLMPLHYALPRTAHPNKGCESEGCRHAVGKLRRENTECHRHKGRGGGIGKKSEAGFENCYFATKYKQYHD